VLAYDGAYAVGALCSYLLLRYVLGGLETPLLLRFLIRMVLATGMAGLAGFAVREGLDVAGADDSKLGAVVGLVAISGVGALVFLALGRLLRIEEVTSVLRVFSRRLGR
jgi:putative peptidoglycan lipid II flippase